MTEHGFYFDSTRCTGCRTCEMACKDYKDTDIDFNYRKVYDMEGGECSLNADGTVTNSAYCYHVSAACNHCEDPACVKVCPTTAMHKDAGTGLVLVDDTKCIGCGYCHMACPYNAPKVNREKGYSVKCDGCIERLRRGLIPACVRVCPTGATYKDEMGRVEIDYDKCIGCRMCMAACPYQLRVRNEETGAVDKCRFCVAAVKPGEAASNCVSACPMGVRTFGDLDDPESEICREIARTNAQPLASDLTAAKIYYVR